MPILIDENRKYQRYRHTIREQSTLYNKGYTTVRSSNVSAVATSGDDLYIRFLNGSLYKYIGKANLEDNILAAASKGKWVWRFLRRPNVPYAKVGKLPLDGDLDKTDEQLFAEQIGIDVEDVDLDSQQQMDKFNLTTLGLVPTVDTSSVLSTLATASLISSLANPSNAILANPYLATIAQ